MFILSKLLLFIISPFNIALILIICGIIFKRFRKKLYIASLTVILFFSIPIFFHLAIKWWEETPVPLRENDYRCKNIVVLGGMSTYHIPSGRVRFTQSGDRFMQALLLGKQNQVENFVISGGSAAITHNERPEAAFLNEYISKLQLLDNCNVLIDSLSRNTYENAVYTREIFEKHNIKKEIALVTSAWHIARAKRCFEKQGFMVTPVGADFLTPTRKPVIGDFILPSASTLANWELLIKEWIGLVTYYVRRYV